MLHVSLVFTLQTQLHEDIAISDERKQAHREDIHHHSRTGRKGKKEGRRNETSQADHEMLATLAQNGVRI